MKNAFKKSLSVLLAFAMVFSSAYVGLNEIDFGEISFNGINLSGVSQFIKELTPDFSVKSHAASESDLTFELESDGASYFVSNCNSSASGDLVIPSTYNDLPVTSIVECTFAGCTSLTSIEIPDSVTSIGGFAFSGCTSLTSIEIPDSVTNIGNNAFIDTGYYNNSENWEDDVLYIDNYLIRAETSIQGNYIIKEGTKSIADYAFYECASLSSIEIPDSITSIGNSAFSGCTSLTSIEIPDSVTSIGNDAFYSCTSLSSIEIPDSVTNIGNNAFIDTGYYNNSENWEDDVLYIDNYLIRAETSIQGNYIIKEGTKSIADYAFYECASLSSIEIPDSITSIGNSAFSGCTSLTTIEIPDSVTSIDYQAFYNCESLTTIEIPDSVTRIGSGAFYSCTSLTSIEIPDSVTSMGNYAFEDCTSLTTVTIGDSVTSIGEYAFYNCTSLTSIEIPDSVTSIGEYAFSGCSSLTSIEIPDSVTSIGGWAFENCTILTSVYITDIAAWCNINFYNSSSNPLCYAKNLYINGELATVVVIPDGVTEIPIYGFNCESLRSIEIPDSVSSIGACAFSNCTSLTSVTIGDSVTSIGDFAFSNCTRLTTIEIPDSVTSIGYQAFYYCTRLTTIEIPDSVTSIGGYAFSGCTSLITVAIGDSVTSIGDYAFDDCTSLTSIEIPDSVTSIGDHAFYNCTSLTTVTIGDSVTSIGESAFRYCLGITDINVAEGNTAYSSLDGVLYNKNQTTLICFPSDKDVTVYKIPDTVTRVEGYGFYNSNLTTLVLGRGLKNVSSYAFSNNYHLKTVVIPSNLTSVSSNAFFYCCNINDVFYEGTEAQWNSVIIAANNGDLTSGRIHYNVDLENWEDHYGEPVVTDAPTCTTDGSQIYTCPCGYEKTETVEATGEHTYSAEWTIDDVPTCTETGLKSHHCTGCNRKADITVVPATGHKSSSWITDKKATVTASGEKHKECTVCGKTLKTEKIPQLKCSAPKISKAENTSSGVKITWGKVSGADKYKVYRSTKKSSGYEYIGATSKTYFTDEKAKSGTTYYYKVKATNEAGDSSSSSAKSIERLVAAKISKVENTTSGVKVTWGKVSGADKYKVYRSTKKSSGFKAIATTSKTYYTDKAAKSGTTYYYKVVAVNDAGDTSASSSAKSIRYLADPALSTPKSTKKGVTLKWSKVSGAQGYIVYRKTGSGSYSKLATVKGSTKVTYTDKSAKKGKKYTYKVKAYYSKTYSAYSNTKTITDKY